MSDKTPAPVPAADAVAAIDKPKMIRVSGLVPADLHEALFVGYRHDQRKEKGEFLGFVAEQFAADRGIFPANKV